MILPEEWKDMNLDERLLYTASALSKAREEYEDWGKMSRYLINLKINNHDSKDRLGVRGHGIPDS